MTAKTCISFAQDEGRLVYQGVKTHKEVLIISMMKAQELLEKVKKAYLAIISIEEGDT